MALNGYDDTRLLTHSAEHEFKAVLAQHGRRAPALVQVSTERYPYLSAIRFVATFSNGLELGWLIEEHRFSEQGRRDVLHPSVETDLRSLYSRLYEDHLIELDLRVAREAYIGVITTTTNPEALHAAQRTFDETVRMIRTSHRGVQCGGGLAGLGRNVEFTNCSFTQTVDVPELEASHELTATQVRQAQDAMAARVQEFDAQVFGVGINQRASYRWTNPEDVIHFAPGVYHLSDAIFIGSEVGDEKANQKGLALLMDWLTPEQRAQYDKHKHFEVTGGSTGKRYRIKHGRQMNIVELDANGIRVCGWCFLPEGQLVAGDVMLAQKIALETNELAALKVANRFSVAFVEPWWRVNQPVAAPDAVV